MTISDLELQTGMTRANIRYYEQEGFLTPRRLENGYRDYSDEDRETLLRIKLLRQLNFTLEEIRKLQQKKLDFSAAMAHRSAQLARDRDQLDIARQVCLDMGREVSAFQDLRAEEYLGRLSGVQPLSPAPQQDRQEPHPWRRFFARAMDVSLATLVILLVQSLVLHSPLRGGNAANIGRTLLAWGVVLLAEPLFLHFLGTTPGKWVWGIQVERNGGGRLTLQEAYRRTFLFFVAGEGMTIPLINFICNFRSYRRYTQGYDLYWEEDSILRFRERGWFSPAVYVAGELAVIVCAVLLALNVLLPPHRGDLTVAEFAENYNACINAWETSGPALKPDGTWEVQPEDPYTLVLFGPTAFPDFTYEVDNGVLHSVACTLVLEDQQEAFTLSVSDLKAAALSFAAARPGTNIFNILSLTSLVDEWDGSSSHLIQWQDVSLTYAIDYQGFESGLSMVDLFVPVEGQPNRLTITFRAEISG